MNNIQVFQDELLNEIVNPNWKNESFEVERKKAYNEGFKKGMDAKETAIKTFFISNVDKVTKIAERLHNEFNKLNFNSKKLFLKPRDLKSFELLFIVSEETYLSATRKEVYKLIREEKKTVNSNEFQFECLIMPEIGETNFNLILSEGYTFTYEPKSR
jgi:hypothetical protein